MSGREVLKTRKKADVFNLVLQLRFLKFLTRKEIISGVVIKRGEWL